VTDTCWRRRWSKTERRWSWNAAR